MARKIYPQVVTNFGDQYSNRIFIKIPKDLSMTYPVIIDQNKKRRIHSC